MAESLRKRARQLKEKWPSYGPLLDFYVAVREAQNASKPTVRVTCATAVSLNPDHTAERDRPRIGKEEFPIDIKSSVHLFAALSRLGRSANEHFATQVDRIEKILVGGNLNLEALLAGGEREEAIKQVATEGGLDAGVLSFLVLNSVRPSIEAARDQLLVGFEPESWRKCSLPSLRLSTHTQRPDGRPRAAFLPLLPLRLPLARRPLVLFHLR